MNIGIVILNYLNWKDTVECVESLKSQHFKNFEIIIVDNNSNNGSFEKLSYLYDDEEHTHILQSKRNLGFAKGNNLGIVYCKKELGLKNILVVNNDVIFTDNNYLAVLTSQNIGDDIGAIGTKIIGSDGKNQNPVYLSISLYNIIKHLLEPLLREKKMGKGLDLIRSVVQKGKRLFKNKGSSTHINKTEHLSDDEKKQEDSAQRNYLLHGSAIYFTENYLNEMNGFYPETFLYYEENILGIIFEKLDLKMKYVDTVKIYHKEDQSSNLSFANSSDVKKKFIRESIKVAIKVKLASINAIKRTDDRYKYDYSN